MHITRFPHLINTSTLYSYMYLLVRIIIARKKLFFLKSTINSLLSGKFVNRYYIISRKTLFVGDADRWVILWPKFCLHHFLLNISINICTLGSKVRSSIWLKKVQVLCFETLSIASGLIYNQKFKKIQKDFALQTTRRVRGW